MANDSDFLLGLAVETVIVVLASLALQRWYRSISFVPHRVKLMPFNRGVIVKGEVVEKVVDSGYHWVLPSRTLIPVDIRPKPFQLSSREIITHDDGAVRISFGGECKVIDPAAYVCGSRDAFATLYVAMERIIAAAGAEFDAHSILTNPTPLLDRIRELIEPRAAQLGLRVTSLEVSSAISIGWILKSAEPS